MYLCSEPAKSPLGPKPGGMLLTGRRLSGPCEAVLGSSPAAAEQGWSLIHTSCPIPAFSCAGSGQSEGYGMIQRRKKWPQRQNNNSQNFYSNTLSRQITHHRHLHLSAEMENWWWPSLGAVAVIFGHWWRQRRTGVGQGAAAAAAAGCALLHGPRHGAEWWLCHVRCCGGLEPRICACHLCDHAAGPCQRCCCWRQQVSG